MVKSVAVWRRVAVLLVSLLGVAGCSESTGEAVTHTPGIPVALATSELRTVPYVLTAIGNVEPVATVNVRSRVDGEITDVLISDGEDVVKGQLMFQIDPRQFQIQVQQMEANIVRDRALLQIATAQEKRYRDLLAQKFVSQDDYAEIKAKTDIAAATLKTDEGTLANARLQLEFTRITAPISGRLGKVELTRGNLVKANDADPLVVLNQINPIYVSFAVPEQDLAEIRKAMDAGVLQVEAVSADGAAIDESGVLSFFDNTVDASTGTIRLRARFDNTRNALWPGQFVNVSMQLGEQDNAVVVPPEAVLTGPKGQFVYVVTKDGKAAVRELTVARTTAEGAVIEEGLAAGEKVVVDGQSRLSPDAEISIKTDADTGSH